MRLGKGAKISTEIDLFLKRCKAPVAGITGSAGKTTTSMLVGRMLGAVCPVHRYTWEISGLC